MNIVQRLRAFYGTHPMVMEAAHEIERLRAENEILKTVKVWDHALNQEEIEAEYNRGP